MCGSDLKSLQSQVFCSVSKFAEDVVLVLCKRSGKYEKKTDMHPDKLLPYHLNEDLS